MCHHAQLLFVCLLLVEMAFHIGQVDLKLLTSGDPPALTSQSVEITGVKPHLKKEKENDKDSVKILEFMNEFSKVTGCINI